MHFSLLIKIQEILSTYSLFFNSTKNKCEKYKFIESYNLFT
jgi:hypothetical protein